MTAETQELTSADNRDQLIVIPGENNDDKKRGDAQKHKKRLEQASQLRKQAMQQQRISN